ncbi:GNAT family N-acetyltransferase [Salinicola corii]|uniref:GNAT family N-acetyltransferase n=1 Tax=Salinicola corii TaxID=2606937 RepID=UPI00165A0245|nr:GNAT family N-acetyltransferase [Salinicola corii]
MADGVSVRWATRDDAASIAGIHVDAWRHNYRGLIDDATLASLDVASKVETWREALVDDTSVFVASRGSNILGWVRIGPFRQTEEARPEVRAMTPGWAELYGFYVSPRAQRQGVGSALWHRAYRWCLDHGYRDVGLWVLAGNVVAIRFYAGCGFRDLELDQNFEIAGQPLVEKLMARGLDSVS